MRFGPGKGIGHFFGDGFTDKDEFKKQIDEWIQVFRNTKPAPGTHARSFPATQSAQPKLSGAKEESRFNAMPVASGLRKISSP
jgi:hypothetical protein